MFKDGSKAVVFMPPRLWGFRNLCRHAAAEFWGCGIEATAGRGF